MGSNIEKHNKFNDMNKIDLHVHSKYSNDGEYGIQELIALCGKNKIDILSITDHNSVSAIQEAIPLCIESEIDLIPGIEIDCAYRGIDLHLLGYNINSLGNDFKDLEKSYYNNVMDSFPQMIENLAKTGIHVDADEVLKKGDGKLPCGELIAEVLLTNEKYHSNKKLTPYMKNGKRSDMPYINFYLDFFAQGKPAYVKIEYMDFHEAIDIVKGNGGIPIVAHPGLNLKGKEDLVTELIGKGAEGLEVFNNYHELNQIEYFADLVMKDKLLMTCGSDFHGKNKPLIEIGKYIYDNRYDDYLQNCVNQINT